MKKFHFAFASLVLAVGMTACGNSSNEGGAGTTTTTDSSMSDANNSASTPNTTAGTTTANANLPLNKDDSTFVMKAAVGGMMEVEAGKIAQQNAESDRVKNFGSMMEKDHTNANKELMSLASSRGVTLPTALPADVQKHLDAMRNMKGKAFDSHYMKMMVDDHKKDIGEFEKEANSGNDADLKSWAAKTLPVLRVHQDSAQAINKARM